MVLYIKHNNSVCDTFLMHQHSLKSVKYMHKWIESRDQKKRKKKRNTNTVNGDYAQILSPHGLDKIRSDKIIILFTAVIYLFTHDSVIFFLRDNRKKTFYFSIISLINSNITYTFFSNT